MLKNQLICEYGRRIEIIKAKYNLNLNVDEFETILTESVNNLQTKDQNKDNWFHCIKSNACLKILLFISLLYSLNLAFSEKPLNLFLCEIQEFIYPGLRLLRITSIPLLKLFPALTELYDETCLIQNPYFYVNDLDCWICKDIKTVDEYIKLDYPRKNFPPFIYKTSQEQINITDLANVYNNNKYVCDKDAAKLWMNGKKAVLTKDFFINFALEDNSKANSYMWRLTRLFPIQVIRSIFPRPEIIPHLGLATERFVAIDEPGSKPYKLPDTECNYVYVIQSQGERIIQLQPAAECSQECNTISIKLQAPFLLWYNWWYWRPVSQQVLNNTTSVSYIGSYC